MILPMYTEDERGNLKEKFNKLIAKLEQIKDKESEEYKRLDEETTNLYAIINDLQTMKQAIKELIQENQVQINKLRDIRSEELKSGKLIEDVKLYTDNIILLEQNNIHHKP